MNFDLLYYLILIFSWVFGILFVILAIVFICTEREFILFDNKRDDSEHKVDKDDAEHKVDKDDIKHSRIIFILCILFIIFIILNYFYSIKYNIYQAESGIHSYNEYKSNYPSDKIIDTEIEQKYIENLKIIEYYKKVGLYGN